METIKKFKKPITKEMLQIVKDGFEEQKGIKVLSLYVDDDDDTICGIYILPLEQSLSFYSEPLLDMMTDIDGHVILMEELGQVLLYAYNLGSIAYFYKLIHYSNIYIPYKQFDKLVNICIENPPLQRIDSNLIEWLDRTDSVSEMRTNTFNKICGWYNQLDKIDLDYDLSIDKDDDVYIREQFREFARQINEKNHEKITELIIYEINKLYIDMQVDLYMTDNK